MKDKCLFVLLIGTLIWCAFQPPLPGSYEIAFVPGLAIALGSSVVSSALNYLAQDETNSANSAMSRAQMDWQSGENALDRDFQREMVNYQLRQGWQYKDPAFLRKAYENAGFNPSFALQGIAGGSGISAGSAPSHSVGGVPLPNYQAPIGAFGSMGQDTLSMLSQILSIERQEIENKQLESSFDTRMALWRAQAGLAENQGGYYQREAGKSYLDWLQHSKTLDNNVQRSFLDVQKIKLELKTQGEMYSQMQLDTIYKKMRNEFQGKLNEKQLQVMQADIAKAYAIANDANMSAKEKREMINKIKEDTRNSKALADSAEAQAFVDKQLSSYKLFHLQDMWSLQEDYIKAGTDAIRHGDNWVKNWSPLVGAGATLGSGALMFAK